IRLTNLSRLGYSLKCRASEIRNCLRAFGIGTMGKNKLGAIPVPPLTKRMWRQVVASPKRAEPFDVVRARYARNADRIDLTLRNGITIRFPRLHIRELTKARPDQLSHIEIQPGGDGISIRSVD